MRHPLLKALSLLLLCGFLAIAARAQEITIPLPRIDHHVRGLVGSLDQTTMTVIDSRNQIRIIRIPPDFKMPQDVHAGKYVRCAYYIDFQNQNRLIRVKPARTQKAAGDTPVNSVPGL